MCTEIWCCNVRVFKRCTIGFKVTNWPDLSSTNLWVIFINRYLLFCFFFRVAAIYIIFFVLFIILLLHSNTILVTSTWFIYNFLYISLFCHLFINLLFTYIHNSFPVFAIHKYNFDIFCFPRWKRARLRPVSLPKFNGNIQEWQRFTVITKQ